MKYVTVEDLKSLLQDTLEKQEYYLMRASNERHKGRCEASNEWLAQAGVLTFTLERLRALIDKELLQHNDSTQADQGQ